MLQVTIRIKEIKIKTALNINNINLTESNRASHNKLALFV